MGKKRKSEASRLDEVDRSMYTTFCSAANSLSQLYSQASNHQRLSFQAGERHALEKLYQWILRQEEGGSRVATDDIVGYLQLVPTTMYTWLLKVSQAGARDGPDGLDAVGGEEAKDNTFSFFVWLKMQNELEYAADEPPASPRLPNQHPQSQTAHLNNSGLTVSSNSYPTATIGQGVRSGLSDQQPKNSVFSNALSSPVRRSLQHYHLSQGGNILNNIISSGNTPRNNETNSVNHQHREVNSPSSNDSMDIHADSPSHDFPY